MNGNFNSKRVCIERFSGSIMFLLYLTISLAMIACLRECCNDGQIKRPRRELQRISCLASVSTIVHSVCPDSTESRDLRSKELGCELIKNTCADSFDFVYHCLLNEWGNSSIELCAPSTKIVGQYCAEFNVGGGIVQEHHKTNASCTLCPYIYNSSESFRYGECFKELVSNFTTTTEASFAISSTTFTTKYTPNTNINPLWFISGILIAIFILTGICVFVLWRRKGIRKGGYKTTVQTMVDRRASTYIR